MIEFDPINNIVAFSGGQANELSDTDKKTSQIAFTYPQFISAIKNNISKLDQLSDDTKTCIANKVSELAQQQINKEEQLSPIRKIFHKMGQLFRRRCFQTEGEYGLALADRIVQSNLQKLVSWINNTGDYNLNVKDLKNLVALTLSGKQIKTIPPEIGLLKNLRVLHLSNNEITSLPEEIGQLSNLTYLHLDNNQLTELPTQIGSLSNLIRLHLDNNQLTELPTQIGSLNNLRELQLKKNKLTDIPEQLCQLSMLEKLMLSENQLTRIPKEIGQLGKLEDLYLSRNQITAIPEEIGQLSNLKMLSLAHNQIASIPEKTGNFPKLKKLYLQNNKLEDLPQSLKSLPRYCEIYVGENQIPMQKIDDFIKASGPTLHYAVAPKTLDEALKHWINLYKIEFPNQPVNEDSFENFSKSLLESDQKNLLDFLNKLGSTEDFKKGGSSKRSTILRAYQAIDHAANDTNFVPKLLTLAAEALSTCEDRVSIYLGRIELEWRLMQKNLTDIDLAKLLVGNARLNLVEEMARLHTTDKDEELETVLFYQIELKDALKLPISTQNMKYYGAVGAATLIEDKNHILDLTKTKEQIYKILSTPADPTTNFHPWNNKIEKIYEKEINQFDEEWADKLEQIPMDNEQEYLESVNALRDQQNIAKVKFMTGLTNKWLDEHWSELEKEIV